MKKRWSADYMTDGHVFIVEEVKENPLKRSEHISTLGITPSTTSEKKQGNGMSQLVSGENKKTLDLKEVTTVWAATIARYSHEPSRPYEGIPLGIKLPYISLEDRENNLKKGYSTYRADEDGNAYSDRIVTTVDAAKDSSYQDLNTMQTLSFIRWDFVNYLKRKYKRCMLAEDGENYQGPVVTPKAAKGDAIARHWMWQQLNLVQNHSDFVKQVKTKIDPTNRSRMLFTLPLKLMGQLRQTHTVIQF